jgi:predicted phosphate transport protein (TIGR00153 family)
MPWLADLIGKSPFGVITEHTKKAYECVKLIRPAAEALVNEDYHRLMDIHHEMSRLEHEADLVKDEVRNILYRKLFFSVSKDAFIRFLSAQDDVADRAQDFVVTLTLRKTGMHPELKQEFLCLIDSVIETAENLLIAAQEFKVLADASFTGKQAKKTLETIEMLDEKEWETDKLQQNFARHFFSLENQLDPITILMYDKWCRTLGQVANAAETAGKYLRAMIQQP